MTTEVQTVIDSRTARFIKPYPFDALRAAFAFRPEGYAFMPSYRDGSWDGLVRFLKYDKVPAGLYRAMKAKLEEKLDIKFVEEFKPGSVEFCGKAEYLASEIMDIRDYQRECVNAMIGASATGGGIVLVPTGAGKTFIAALFLKLLEGPACFIVDELTLLDQAREEIQRVAGEPVGFVGRSEYQPERLTVATIQTLSKHSMDPKFMKWLRSLQAMIIDEFHVMLNRRQSDLVERYRPPVVIGLTATLSLDKPWTRVKAYAIAGPVIYRMARKAATEQGYLTDGVVVQLGVSNYMKRQEEWQHEYRLAVAQNQHRNEIATALIDACLRAGRRVIVLVEWVEHVAAVAAPMRERGLQFRIAFGGRSVGERRKAIREFESGKINLIIANRVFGKGINIKAVDCIVDLTAGRNKDSALQRFGRGVRLAEGKKALLYFDLADFGNRFEEFSIIRHRAFSRSGIRVLQIPFRASLNLDRLVTKTVQIAEGDLHGTETVEETRQAISSRTREAS